MGPILKNRAKKLKKGRFWPPNWGQLTPENPHNGVLRRKRRCEAKKGRFWPFWVVENPLFQLAGEKLAFSRGKIPLWGAIFQNLPVDPLQIRRRAKNAIIGQKSGFFEPILQPVYQ